MRRNRRTEVILHNLYITGMAEEGRGVARHENQVIFVDGAVPGDRVDALVYRRKKSFSEARIHSILESSPHRTSPFCKHYGICGGCKWQHLNYEAQVKFKSERVDEAIRRIGGVTDAEVLPILVSDPIRHYRNKLDFSFADRQWIADEDFNKEEGVYRPGLGFHLPGKFDRVIDIEECHLMDPLADQIRNEVRRYAIEGGLTFMNIRHRSGFLRSLILRNNLAGEWMLILMHHEPNELELVALLENLVSKFPALVSVYTVLNEKGNDSIYDLDLVHRHGKRWLEESVGELRFRISPKSFFQTNSRQTAVLYAEALRLAELRPTDTVYDLYTGTGTIANYIARYCKQVTGMEYVPEAIEDAKINAERNAIQNTHFLAGDIKDLLTGEYLEKNAPPDVIITDPPRAGMHPSVVETLRNSRARRIVYISCNPATQARDISLLNDRFKLVRYRPVDMFPHTTHIENIAVLERI